MISGASLRNQAYGDNFYGKDTSVEHFLSDLEGKAARIIKNALRDNSPPSAASTDYYTLLCFAFLMKSRTKYAAEKLDKDFEQMLKAAYSIGGLPKKSNDGWRLRTENPSSYNLAITASCLVMASDLQCRLLVNSTEDPFWTSDNPVVAYNQLMEMKRSFNPQNGIASKGLELFLPLTPRHCLVYFDAGVYEIGTHGRSSVQITDNRDVHALNRIQVITADRNVYCSRATCAPKLATQLRKCRRYRERYKSTVRQYRTNQPNRYVIGQHQEDIRCKLELSFISMKKAAMKYSLGRKAVHVRNERLMQLHSEFFESVRRGDYRTTDLIQYLEDRGFFDSR